MKKIVLIQDRIAPYRLAIFNMLSERYDLTVLYSSGNVSEEARFSTMRVDKWAFHGYKCFRRSLKKLVQPCDAVIAPFDRGQLDVCHCMKNHHGPKWVLWGIGVPADYQTRYDSPDVASKDRLPALVAQCDAAVFYSDYPKRKYSRLGIAPEKLFVAPNTVSINHTDWNNDRHSLLFVGSLYPQKKVYELVEAYHTVLQEKPLLPPLRVIGDGSERPRLEAYIQQHHLQEKIHLLGEIYNEDLLQSYFRDAIACLSPDQAGLSVLKSMGYGVPYVTSKEAITGGEIFNISHGETGVLLDSLSELPAIIADIADYPSRYTAMGKQAYEYYWKNRTPEHMVQGFVDAIEYATSR